MEKQKRKRAVRTIVLDRCEDLASKIVSMNPPKEVIYNSLKELAVDCRTEGYMQHVRDAASFRKSKRATIREDWDIQKTAIDDRVHGRKELKVE